MSIRILRYVDLTANGYGSRQTIWRKVRRNDFPAPIDLGNGQVGWPEQTIADWVASRPEKTPHVPIKSRHASNGTAKP